MKNFSIIEYQAQRVLTSDQLAQAYECTVRNISDNFKNNEGRFEEGKHYFKLTGEALKNFRDLQSENIGLQISPMTRALYLWTKRGASRHCKCLALIRLGRCLTFLRKTTSTLNRLSLLHHMC